MKRTAMQHTKLKRLVRALKVPQYAAVGILESLWHLTAREAPEGNIGKLSNEDIAAWIDWDGTADNLIEGLVTAGWLDEVIESRLVVHDWHEHADDATKLAIKRQREKEQQQKATVSETVGQKATTGDKTPLPEPLPVPKPEPLISAEMVASGVMTELCISTRDLAVTLDGVCRAEMKKGRDATDLRDSLITAYREWEIAKPRLSYSKSTKNFFGEGDWRNKTGWPWKPGESPPVRKSSGENKALQAIKEREEAVRRERGL